MISIAEAFRLIVQGQVRRALGFKHPWDEDFEVYVILTPPDCPPLWHWQYWNQIAPLLQPLIATLPVLPRVESWQSRDSRPNWVKPRLGFWNEQIHQKWTHRSPIANSIPDDQVFAGMQAWHPPRKHCGDNDLSPDFFFALNNRGWASDAKLRFNQMITLALRANSDTKLLELQGDAVRAIARQTSAVLTVRSRRPWGIRWGDGPGYLRMISDPTQLFKQGGVTVSEPPSPAIFVDPWDKVEIN